MSEAFSRILIDKGLEDSGWDLLKQVHFELSTAMGQFLLDYRAFCSTIDAEIALESLELIPVLTA